MRFYKNTFFLILFTCTVSGKLNAQSPLDAFDNWVGRWKAITQEGTVYESWKKNADGSFSGTSWKINPAGDSLHLEDISVLLEGESIFYCPIVKDQHQGLAVKFSMLIGSSGEWLFYNPTNDFPKYILYKLVDKDHLKASISNSDQEDQPAMVFDYTRD